MVCFLKVTGDFLSPSGIFGRAFFIQDFMHPDDVGLGVLASRLAKQVLHHQFR